MGRRVLLVLYDENCRFCTAVARFLERRGIDFAPIGSRLGDTWLRDLSGTERYAEVHAIDALGRRHSGGRALPLVLDALPGGGPLALLARSLPALTDVGYRTVARNRRVLSRIVGAFARLTRASRARAG